MPPAAQRQGPRSKVENRYCRAYDNENRKKRSPQEIICTPLYHVHVDRYPMKRKGLHQTLETPNSILQIAAIKIHQEVAEAGETPTSSRFCIRYDLLCYKGQRSNRPTLYLLCMSTEPICSVPFAATNGHRDSIHVLDLQVGTCTVSSADNWFMMQRAFTAADRGHTLPTRKGPNLIAPTFPFTMMPILKLTILLYMVQSIHSYVLDHMFFCPRLQGPWYTYTHTGAHINHLLLVGRLSHPSIHSLTGKPFACLVVSLSNQNAPCLFDSLPHSVPLNLTFPSTIGRMSGSRCK